MFLGTNYLFNVRCATLVMIFIFPTRMTEKVSSSILTVKHGGGPGMARWGKRAVQNINGLWSVNIVDIWTPETSLECPIWRRLDQAETFSPLKDLAVTAEDRRLSSSPFITNNYLFLSG